jgi:arginyl-tRNA synthetase
MPESEWLPIVRAPRPSHDDGRDQGRSRRAQHQARRVLLRALADRTGNNKVARPSRLRAKGDVYEGRLPPPKGAPVEDWEDREQTLFRATAFGDDVDRPLKKSDGSYTYFASDIAYHKNKFDRGFRDLIDVWGADHGGYIKRMQAAVKAVTGGQGDARREDRAARQAAARGEPVKMSKRSGDFVTLREVVDEVGATPCAS